MTSKGCGGAPRCVTLRLVTLRLVALRPVTLRLVTLRLVRRRVATPRVVGRSNVTTEILAGTIPGRRLPEGPRRVSPAGWPMPAPRRGQDRASGITTLPLVRSSRRGSRKAAAALMAAVVS